MNRIEIIEKLNELEKRKEQFDNLLNDVNDYYCKEAGIIATLETSAYDRNKKYKGEHIKIDKTLFIAYLKTESGMLENEIQDLISNLVK